MISLLFSRLIILLFGTLYPAYASYKAVRTKNVKEYVKWMMYWIVYAFFTCIETFTDIFLSWFPFYYEVKVVIVLWLLSPATKGSSVLYRKFVHPMLTRREQEIDEYLNQAKERGYSAVLQLGSRGVNYATNVIMQTALKTIEYVSHGEAQNKLTASQSDPTIYEQPLAAQDECDAFDNNLNEQWDINPRPSSLTALETMQIEFSDDDLELEPATEGNLTLLEECANDLDHLQETSDYKTKLRNRTAGSKKLTSKSKKVRKSTEGSRRKRRPSNDLEIDQLAAE